LSDDRYAEFCKIAEFTNFPQWLEEDCQAVLVYLRWPELATDEQINSGVTMARHAQQWGVAWEAINAWLDRPCQSHILDRSQKHVDAVKHLWERRSLWTSGIPGAWGVNFRREDETKTVLMEYPKKRYYTDEELQAANRETVANYIKSLSIPDMPPLEVTASEYTIKSVKRTEAFLGELEDAIVRAKEINSEYSPAFGVQVENSSGETVWDSEEAAYDAHHE